MTGESMILQKKTISNQVADMIRQRILSGAYEEGYQLRQEHLASDLGVSRIPVREALHQLHSEGFVDLIAHKGAVVTRISLEEILEMHELRARIETWLLSLSVPLMTDEHFELALDNARRFGQEGDGFKYSEFSHALNWDFHSSLYVAANRPTTVEMVSKIHKQLERYTRMMVSLAGSKEAAHHDHLALLELCKNRDVPRAIAMLETHIMVGGKLLVKSLEGLGKA